MQDERVGSATVVQKTTRDLLNELFVGLVEERTFVRRGWLLRRCTIRAWEQLEWCVNLIDGLYVFISRELFNCVTWH